MKKWNEMKMAKYVHVVPALAFQLVFLPSQEGDCTLEAINEIITKKYVAKKINSIYALRLGDGQC